MRTCCTSCLQKAELLTLLQMQKAVVVALTAAVDEGPAGLSLTVEVPAHGVPSAAALLQWQQAHVCTTRGRRDWHEAPRTPTQTEKKHLFRAVWWMKKEHKSLVCWYFLNDLPGFLKGSSVAICIDNVLDFLRPGWLSRLLIHSKVRVQMEAVEVCLERALNRQGGRVSLSWLKGFIWLSLLSLDT